MKRILLYAQSMAGSGHFVRMSELARALASRHHVQLLDGGMPVPRAGLDEAVRVVPLPRLRHDAEWRPTPLDPGQTLEEVLQERGRLLRQTVETFSPEVVVIEYFPFGRHTLKDEILGFIACARKRPHPVRVVSSVRDQIQAGDTHQTRDVSGFVMHHLHHHFDALLVHADPRVVRLEDQVSWAGQLTLPIAYTGYVSEKPHPRGPLPAWTSDGLVLFSSGGVPAPELLTRTLDAWRRARARGSVGNRHLVLFTPLRDPAPSAARVDLSAERVHVLPYRTDFLQWLAAADLSISRGGYNTCMNVLETRTRAVLIPNPRLVEQRERVRRLSELGLVRGLSEAHLDADRLAHALEQALASARPEHDLDLDGARRTVQLLEELLETGWSDPKP